MRAVLEEAQAAGHDPRQIYRDAQVRLMPGLPPAPPYETVAPGTTPRADEMIE